MDEQLAALTERFRSFGAEEPDTWARSEVTEDLPQTATFLLLQRLWADCIQPWRDPAVLERVPRTKALMESGADPAALSAAMCLAAYEAVFGALHALDEGNDLTIDEDFSEDEAINPDELPSWAVVELDAEDEPTGRQLAGLHESLLGMDPTRAEGADFV